MENFMILLFIASVMTGLLTEAMKKTFDGTSVKVSNNMLAVIMSAVASCIVSIVYIIQNSVAMDAKVIVEIVLLFIMSWICSMIGYDKVKQSISQFTVK
jgi:hypothetical protein